jgi:D-alanyl-D-alanine carboxypeptidase
VRVVMAKERGAAQTRMPRWGLLGRSALGAAVALGLLAGPATARHGHREVAFEANSGPVFEWILLDAGTGQVLSEQNADVLTYPASLTKMMTLYLVFEALNQGRIRLDQTMYVSPYAAGRAPSKLALTPGDSVPVRDLVLGVVTRSANDAATVLAEGLAGSEGNFARYMTWKARQLGMSQTWYQNASGLPDPQQRTTARDIARLSLALYQHFPREYRYFATREFDFRGDIVRTHNHLMEWYQGADGIKTGYINASGFNLAASAVRDGRRLIGVIMGGRSARSRDVQMASLLDQGFAVLASGRPASPQPATVVAVSQPISSPPAAPAAAPAVAAVAPTRAATAAAVGDAGERPRSGIDRVAQAALRHLAPVGRAEAATSPREPAASEEWAIQLGAFSAERAAEHAIRQAATLAVARGKPHQVMAPAKREKPALYRARLLHFTQKGAQAACVELRRRNIACSVVRPAGLKLASD